MSLLVISLLALVLGPLVHRIADRARTSLVAVDGFVMIAVVGLVLVHIIPHSLESAGPWVLAPALIGFLGPGLIERTLLRAAKQAHVTALILAVVGLVVHAFFDGLALAEPGRESSALAVAVVLHRLPIAITIWYLLRPSSGFTVAAGTLVGIGVATIAGFALADPTGLGEDAAWLVHFQALVAGSLLHVVIHRPSFSSARNDSERLFAGVAALVAVAVVVFFADEHLSSHQGEAIHFGDAFVALAIETAPALLIAFALAGLVQVFMPQASLRWMRTGNAFSESGRGVAFGLPLPICSCGVIPLYRTLIGKGVPATAAMAFLVATPELGLDAVLISLPLLGSELTVARVVCAGVVAVIVGWLVGRMAERVKPAPELETTATLRGDLRERVVAGLRFGFGEVVDHTAPWLILGVVIAALATPLLDGPWLRSLPWGVDVALFAIIGMPMYVCASGATPLAAVLLFSGVSPGAALAFLLSGPATNVTTFGVLRSLHGAKIAAAFGAVIAVLAIGLGLLVNEILGEVKGLSLFEAVHEDRGVIALICLGALAVVFAISILRQGPRQFVDQIIAPYGKSHDHDHDHDLDDDHRPTESDDAAEDCC